MPVYCHSLRSLLLIVVELNMPTFIVLVTKIISSRKLCDMVNYLLFTVIVESGNIISFVAYINSGYCNIYRNIIGLSKPQSGKVVSFKPMYSF